jgi:hypothetical protein
VQIRRLVLNALFDQLLSIGQRHLPIRPGSVPEL